MKYFSHVLKLMMPTLVENAAANEAVVSSKPKTEYQTDEYFELYLPVALAVMVGEEIVVEGLTSLITG